MWNFLIFLVTAILRRESRSNETPMRSFRFSRIEYVSAGYIKLVFVLVVTLITGNF